MLNNEIFILIDVMSIFLFSEYEWRIYELIMLVCKSYVNICLFCDVIINKYLDKNVVFCLFNI